MLMSLSIIKYIYTFTNRKNYIVYSIAKYMNKKGQIIWARIAGATCGMIGFVLLGIGGLQNAVIGEILIGIGGALIAISG